MAKVKATPDSYLRTVEDNGDGTGYVSNLPALLVSTLHASAAETVTGQSSGVDVGSYSEAVLALNVTAASGTTPTLDLKIQTSDDNADWYDLGSAFTQITAVSKPAVLKLTNFGRYVRALWTIAGTTPSFTFSLKLTAKY